MIFLLLLALPKLGTCSCFFCPSAWHVSKTVRKFRVGLQETQADGKPGDVFEALESRAQSFLKWNPIRSNMIPSVFRSSKVPNSCFVFQMMYCTIHRPAVHRPTTVVLFSKSFQRVGSFIGRSLHSPSRESCYNW